MAYSASGLTRMAGGGGHNLWFYDSTDAMTAVRASGYFNDAASMLNVGDAIFVLDSDAPALSISLVLSNTGSVVDIADGTAITVSDSD
jgi:hypothetical protein|tara:strand:+ start:1234 stop:1497 length:264 start_codon:yes stop_codon:yes gene_type:complete